MPKHTGNPFRNLLSSRLDLWKVKRFKGGWNGLAKAGMKIQVQSYHMPKQKENPLQSQMDSFPVYATIDGVNSFHVEEMSA